MNKSCFDTNNNNNLITTIYDVHILRVLSCLLILKSMAWQNKLFNVRNDCLLILH